MNEKYIYFVTEVEHRYSGAQKEYRGQTIYELDWRKASPPIAVFETRKDAEQYLEYIATLCRNTSNDFVQSEILESNGDYVFRLYDKTCDVRITRTLTITKEVVRKYNEEKKTTNENK